MFDEILNMFLQSFDKKSQYFPGDYLTKFEIYFAQSIDKFHNIFYDQLTKFDFFSATN